VPVQQMVAVIAIGLVMILVGGCGGSSSGTSPSSGGASRTAAPSSSSGPTTAGSATARIRHVWTVFFDAGTPATQRIALLQDGSALAAVIKAQSSSPLAAGSAAKVSSVQVTSPVQASVHYAITLGGKTALPGQIGVAVKQRGEWLVSRQSFCGLLALEGTHPAACAGSSPSS
jgi:hypothetical protein